MSIHIKKYKSEYQRILDNECNVNENIQLYNYFSKIFINKTLNEVKHISTNFENVSKYLTKNIKTYQLNTKIYTGWNWHISTELCTNDNNENSGYPIYIIIEDLTTNIFAYVDKRDMHNNKIFLHINSLAINDVDLYSKLMHEFLHVRSSYSRFFNDPLQLQRKNQYNAKNIMYYYNIQTKEYSLHLTNSLNISDELFNDTQIDKVNDLLFIMSKTEQEARINQVYQYIVSIFDKSNLKNLEELIEETNKISLLEYFNDLYTNINDYIEMNYLNIPLCIAYYLNEFSYMHYNELTKEHMLKYFNKIDKEKIENNYKNNIYISKAAKCIYANLIVYEKKISNIIKDAINDIKNGAIK